MKKTAVFIFLGFLISCSDLHDKWYEKKDNLTNIEEFIQEFGQPFEIIDNSNYLEKHNESIEWFQDRFNHNKSVDEIVELLDKWNDLAKINFDTLYLLGFYKIQDSTHFSNSISYYDYLNNGLIEEGEFLENEFPISWYQEKLKDRINRLNLINEKFNKPLFWESIVYSNPTDSKKSGYIKPNDLENTRLELDLGTSAIKPEWKKEYSFFLKSCKFGDEYSGSSLPLPSYAKIKMYGKVNEYWSGEIKVDQYGSTYYTYDDTYLFTCDECGGSFKGRPYQCLFEYCVTAKVGQEVEALGRFCSCNCAISNRLKAGFYNVCR